MTKKENVRGRKGKRDMRINTQKRNKKVTRKENIEKRKQSEGSRIGVTKKRRVGLLLTASYETHGRGNSLGVVLQNKLNMYFYSSKTQTEVQLRRQLAFGLAGVAECNHCRDGNWRCCTESSFYEIAGQILFMFTLRKEGLFADASFTPYTSDKETLNLNPDLYVQCVTLQLLSQSIFSPLLLGCDTERIEQPRQPEPRVIL